jgi:uncharacterized repeat protein (TIGR03809 family)
MVAQLDAARGREIVARWCALAERRLEYLTELYEMGRWRRYYNERGFLAEIREAKEAVQTWRGLLSREASSDNRSIDLSWLGRPRTAVPAAEPWCDLVHLAKAAEIVRDARAGRPVHPEEEVVDARETPAVPSTSEAIRALVPELATIATRYPQLRNAL